MKCIHCGTRTWRRDRTGGRCPRCRHAFAFEPATNPHRLGDPAFQAAIQRVSAGGSLFFTPRQLFYALDRVRRRGRPHRPQVSSWLSGGDKGRAELVPAGPDMSFELQFLPCLRRWTEVHGAPPRLLPPLAPGAPAREVPPDVAAFSFDRAVVTDRAETAAMLVANGFHFEHNCAVLSADGYPYGIADTVKTMLRRNPRLTVFALHDASLDGCTLPVVLRGAAWFPEKAVRVVDVGLRPGTVRRAGLPSRPGRPGRMVLDMSVCLPLDDVDWLQAGAFAELDVIAPRALMRVLQAAFAAAGPYDDPAYGGVRSSKLGFVWMGDLPPRGKAEAAATDGFG